jgi:hypothetical protein
MVLISKMKNKIYKKSIIRSLMLSFMLSLVFLLVVLVFRFYQINNQLKQKNINTLNIIKCDEYKCNTEEWANDINKESSFANFIIHKNGFFIEISNEFINSSFNYSDINFLKEYEKNPKIYKSLTSEEWFLYTDSLVLDNKKYYIMLGIAKNVSWRLYSLKEDASNLLKNEMARFKNEIQKQFFKNKKTDFLNNLNTKADAFQIVRDDGKVMNWNWGIPAFLPKEYFKNIENLNFKNFKIELIDKNLYLFRVDKNYYLYTISGEKFISYFDLLLMITVFILVFLLINLFFRKIFIKRLILENIPDISIEEALKKGENEIIEFKSKDSLKFPETLLKSIVSMANTSGGIIFVGVRDNGELDPIQFENYKELDLIKSKLTNFIRNSITPVPLVKIEDIYLDHNKVIFKLKVGEFYDVLYSVNGVFYRRLGASDIPMDFYYLRSINIMK